jgi:hypothetical protein
MVANDAHPEHDPKRMKVTRYEYIAARVRQQARRMLHKLRGKRIAHFLHIGKTGGSAIKEALEQCRAEPGPYVIELHSHAVHLNHVPRGDKVFFFVRDPISRFVSGFYSRYRQGQPRYHVPWNDRERPIFERFHTPNQLALALSSDDAGERALAETAMRTIRHVKSSYWDWFRDADYFRSRQSDILFIGHQDRLREDFALLKEMLGVPADLELPEDDLRAHRNPSGVDKTIDETASANLRTWYQKDYDFLALCESLMPARGEANP